MATRDRTTRRVLSPVQLRAIALRIRGQDITQIAREVGHDRTTVSRWFSRDELVIEELERRGTDLYEAELQGHANLRMKAIRVVDAALDAGDLRAALAVLRQGPKLKQVAEGGTGRPFDPFASPIGMAENQDHEGLLDLGVTTSPWEFWLSRADILLRSADPVHDAEGLVDRLLLLDDVGLAVIRGLEEAPGEGLPGFSPLPERRRTDLVEEAASAIEGAFAIVAGDEADEDEPPTWPGEREGGQAVHLMGEALAALLASLEGVPEALEAGAGEQGARVAARLVSARDAGRFDRDGSGPPTVEDLTAAIDGITEGFRDLVGVLIEGAALVVDAEWAEEGAPTARSDS
jgi:hypothetical protein